MPEQPGRRGPRRAMPALVLLGFFAFILAEVSLLVWVSNLIGWWTLVALMVSTVLGAYLLQREWRKAWTQLGESVKTGTLPAGRTADAVLVLMGGFMLIMPGFITDIIGLLLLLPFTRPGVRSVLGWWVGRTMAAGTGPVRDSMVIEGEIVEPDTAPGTRAAPQIPPDEDDRNAK